MSDINILDFIPFGMNNAITRDSLSSLLGLSDRAVRKLIEEARREGAFIINKQDGRGYYQSDATADLQAHYRQNHARAMKLLQQQTHIRRELMARGVSVKW